MDTPVGPEVRGTDGLYPMAYRNKRVLWILDGGKSMHKRLFMCGHMQEAGRRGVTATLIRLCWHGMWTVKHRPSVADSVERMMPEIIVYPISF